MILCEHRILSKASRHPASLVGARSQVSRQTLELLIYFITLLSWSYMFTSMLTVDFESKLH